MWHQTASSNNQQCIKYLTCTSKHIKYWRLKGIKNIFWRDIRTIVKQCNKCYWCQFWCGSALVSRERNFKQPTFGEAWIVAVRFFRGWNRRLLKGIQYSSPSVSPRKKSSLVFTKPNMKIKVQIFCGLVQLKLSLVQALKACTWMMSGCQPIQHGSKRGQHIPKQEGREKGKQAKGTRSLLSLYLFFWAGKD